MICTTQEKTFFPKSRLLLISFIFLLFISQSHLVFSQDISIKTYVNRTKLAVGEQFILTIEVSGSDAQAAPSPQLPDLSEFADYVGSSSAQNFQIINGQMSVSKSTTNYYITRVEGKHQIPAVAIAHRGKIFHSQPIAMEIVKGSAAPSPTQRQQPSRQPQPQPPGSQIIPENTLEGNLFLQAEVNRRDVYPNQPVTTSYKIYTRVNVTNYAISKLPKMLGFWSEDLSLPQRPVTYEKVVNGKKFLVAEIKKTALFPTDTGEKIIDPMEIECEVRFRDQRQSRDIFDRFFEDDFFSESLFGKRVRTKIASKPIKINVKPLPQEAKPSGFSGAVGKFTMNTSLDKDQITANEAVSLKVLYSGTGNIKMLTEPKIVFPQDFETYEPKVDQKINRKGNTINGSKLFEYVLIPRYAGEYRIKPFAFSYFDPVKKAYNTLRSQEFKIRVLPGSGSGTAMPTGLSRKEIKFIGRDIRFIKQSSAKFHHIGDYFYRTFWFGLLLVIPLLALGGVLVYRHRLDKMAENVAYARSRRANQMAKKRLSRAHKLMNPETQKEFYSEISLALLGFIADKLNLSAAGLMCDEVAEKLREHHVEEAVISELLSCLQQCDFLRFAPAESKIEEMKALYDHARSAIVNLDRARLG